MLIGIQTPSTQSPCCCSSNKAKFTPAAQGRRKGERAEDSMGEGRGREWQTIVKVRKSKEKIRGQRGKETKRRKAKEEINI